MITDPPSKDDASEEEEYDYGEEEDPDGPFQMITETNFADEDYYDL